MTYHRHDDDLDDAPPRAKRRPRGCGGWANYSGPCGATDCPDCYPGSWDEDEDDYPIPSAVDDIIGDFDAPGADAELWRRWAGELTPTEFAAVNGSTEDALEEYARVRVEAESASDPRIARLSPDGREDLIAAVAGILVDGVADAAAPW